MLLRKHLTNARIVELTQPPMERVAIFHLDAIDELGDRVQRKLILEVMGRYSNLILLDGDGRIMDCLRRVDGDMSAQRQILPGLFYHLPPTQGKHDPMTTSRAEMDLLLADAPEETQGDKWLLSTFGGLSPLVCRELAFQAGGRTDIPVGELGSDGKVRLLDGLQGLMTRITDGNFTPTVLSKEGRPTDFTFSNVGQYGIAMEVEELPSFSTMLDEFYDKQERIERIRQRGQDLIRSVTNARDRAARKIGFQEKELLVTLDRDRLRELGDIVTANLHAMERGMTVLRASDFYDPAYGEVDIKLDALLTPQQNAAKYYKDYNRAKTAQEMLTQQLEKGQKELGYLNSVLESISLAEGEKDLQEIRQELVDTGYLRRSTKIKGREKRVVSKPMEFRSTTGLRISVGKNNSQNDALTTKQAFKSDTWLHTQKIHGSHVILWTEGQRPDPQSLTEAACLAAWFSQGRSGHKVPVDYTTVKYVKKPAGARPGMVIYTTYETAMVTPDEALVKALRQK